MGNMGRTDSGERVIIITGGGGGVGRTVSLRWLQSGASVLVVDHSRKTIDEFSREWAKVPGSEATRLATLATDVTTGAGASEMVAKAEQSFGRPADTLIHLVGAFAMGPLDAPDAPAAWDRMMGTNLQSAFHCYRAALPALRARGGGWIVGLGSRAALAPPAQLAAYAASKAGLLALTRSLSAEVRAQGIHVNVILASIIDTPANRRAMGDDAAKDWVRPDDIADATEYLCSDRARAVHGTALEVYANA
jgi:NAD(P)-dependent dehydrogenase (short-subunit alcohol dehydrogenase family)